VNFIRNVLGDGLTPTDSLPTDSGDMTNDTSNGAIEISPAILAFPFESGGGRPNHDGVLHPRFIRLSRHLDS